MQRKTVAKVLLLVAPVCRLVVQIVVLDPRDEHGWGGDDRGALSTVQPRRTLHHPEGLVHGSLHLVGHAEHRV